MDYVVYDWFLPVSGNAGATDGSTKRGKKDKSSVCKGGIFHKYSSLAAYLIPALKESCLAMALLLIQCLCPMHSLTVDRSFIAFLLHGFKQV